MGEATPGPLILVVTFLGFLAGYRDDLQSSAASGLTGAGIATWFAFLPSFAMILALALATVGSVIVGAIVLLGLRLAEAAFLPNSQLDPVAILVTITAGIALLSGRLAASIVVGLAAVVGVVRMLLG
jgi:chromate transporter